MSTRIAIVCPIASGGGITEAFFNSLEMLQRQGATPIAIVPEQFSFLDRLKATGFDIHTIAGLERGGTWNFLLQTARLRQAIKRAKPDILVLNNGRHVAAQKRANPGLPIVAIYHGGKTQRYAKADRIITINDDQRGYVISMGYPANRVVVVDNALPLETLPPYVARQSRSNPPTVGTLRLLEPAKGIDTLIEAIAELAGRGLRLETRIGSNGSQKEKLVALAKRLGVQDLVHFDGWIEDKDAYFDAMDIYVLPSRAEEWGIGVVEANAARLPVIATNTLGPKRIVEHNVTGLLVPKEDPAAMADAIAAVASDTELTERLAKAGYERCAERYLLPKIAPIFYREIMHVLTNQKS